MTLKEEIKQTLEKNNFRPNKLLGQNFLIDKKVLEKIINTAQLLKTDTVLEVGPGLGILTRALAPLAGRVIAVEKDKDLAKLLQEKFIGQKNVIIIQNDILKFSASDFQVENEPLKNYRVVANIPYYLTSHLIRVLLESNSPPQEIILMIQKEVAQRICAKPPEMSLLAVSVQFYAQPKIIEVVSKNSFWPKPKVDSAIIKIKPLLKSTSEIDPKIFFKIVKAGFAHPRKQLINNLCGGLKIDRAKITEVLKKTGLAPEQRAETLSLDNWLQLYRQLNF